jgi:hypothetical protein
LEAGYPKHTALLLYSTLSVFVSGAQADRWGQAVPTKEVPTGRRGTKRAASGAGAATGWLLARVHNSSVWPRRC